MLPPHIKSGRTYEAPEKQRTQKTLIDFLLAHQDLEISLTGINGSVFVKLTCRQTDAVHGEAVAAAELRDGRKLRKMLRALESMLERNEVPGEPRVWTDPSMACGHRTAPTCSCICHIQSS